VALLTIAGTAVANPASIEVGEADLSKSNRTASGRMVMEIIATKRRLDVTWRYLPDPERRKIRDLIRANRPFFLVTWQDGDSADSMIAYAGDRRQKLWLPVGGVRYWEEFSVAFIEQ